MTDVPLEPEDLAPDDDWSREMDTESEPEPWAWIDEAVVAWDESSEVEGVLAGSDDFDVLDDEDDAGDADDDPGAPEISAPDGGPDLVPVELEVSDEPDDGDAVDDLVMASPLGDLIGSCPVTSLVETLALAGVDDAEDILSALGSDHLVAREVVGALDVAGVPARVEYTDLGDLLERLSTGVEVVLGAGEPHAVVSIDPGAGAIVVEPLAGGDRTTLAMDAFEAAWDETANEVMVVNSDDSGILLGSGQVWVLPVAVDAMMAMADPRDGGE